MVVFVLPTDDEVVLSDVVLVLTVGVLTEVGTTIHGVVPEVSDSVVSVSLLSSIHPLCKHPAKTSPNIITFADNIFSFFQRILKFTVLSLYWAVNFNLRYS